MNYNQVKQTPWGKSDHATMFAPGIIFFGTPSHGGIWLSKERQKALPKGIKNFLKNYEWWEEDCDFPVPFVFFAKDIKENWINVSGWGDFNAILESCKQTNKRCHPEFTI